jgi:hypothetical protein
MKALLSALPLTVSQMEGGELGIPINLTAFATIQGVSSELNVTSQAFEFDLVRLAEVREVGCRFFDLKQPQGILLLEIGEKLPNLIRGELVDLLAYVFDGGTHEAFLSSTWLRLSSAGRRVREKNNPARVLAACRAGSR